MWWVVARGCCVWFLHVLKCFYIFLQSLLSLSPSLSFQIREPFISDAAILNYNKTHLYTHFRLMLLLIDSIDQEYKASECWSSPILDLRVMIWTNAEPLVHLRASDHFPACFCSCFCLCAAHICHQTPVGIGTIWFPCVDADDCFHP